MNAHVAPPASCKLNQARRFLTKAVPWQGDFINIISREIKDGKPLWGGRAVKSLDDAINSIQWILKQNPKTDLYVCMSSQLTADKRTGKNNFIYHRPIRTQQNAVALKSLFIDVDYKGGDHGYDTEDHALQAIAAFIKAVGLPKPSIVVRSGGGCHLHWTVSRALPPLEWKQLAHSLAEAGKRHGLKADWQVTIDSARILRIAGTENHKQATPDRLAWK